MAKRATKKDKQEDNELLQALKFVRLAQQDSGTVYQTHCRFYNGQVVAFDGVLAAGHPVKEEWPICPHTYRLVAALEKARGAVSMTALDNKQLVVKTDKLRALISCIGDGDLTYVHPDTAQWPLSDAFRVAAETASIFTTEGGTTVMAAAVVTRDGSIIGTDGRGLIEAWHGEPTPPGMIIPKVFITALGKVAKPIAQFGFSGTSLTIHFTDGAWLKTQLYQEQFPNVDKVLAWTETARPRDMPKDVYEAIKVVAPFSENNTAYVGDGRVQSHRDDNKGASYQAAGAVETVALNIKQMLLLEPHITKIDFTGNDTVVCFFGDKLRGALSHIRQD